MNKKSILSAILAAGIAIFGLSGCQVEQIDTDQLDNDVVTLGGFAPNPVARGGMLRIVGSNLDKVDEVIIPGVSPISDIEVVSSGRLSEIRVKVPVDGPEVGKISIKSGSITLTSKAELEYSEPIIFDSFSPSEAMPGDIITIKGDYMNNIKVISFEGGAAVTEFASQSRYELKLEVPSSAISGKITLSDVDEANNPDGLTPNLFYSEQELAIGDPTVKESSKGTIKAGAEVSVEGAYLNMIKSVNFGGEEAEFTVAADGTSLVAVLPDKAPDGELVLVSFAGKEFNAGAYETVVPSELKVTAESRFKAGLKVTITGKDLDLATKASLAGTELTISTGEDGISFDIPEKATDGTIALSLANGKSVETEALTLVKPVVTSITPLELYAGDENIVITGEDLDLVVSATLGGSNIEIKEGATDTKIELVSSVTSVSGKVVLTLANGVTINPSEDITMKYHSLVVVSERPDAQHIGLEVVLKGSNFDLVENVFIGEEKVTKYSLRTPTELRFLMPWCKVGSYSISFHLFNGDVETLANPIEVKLELDIKELWKGSSYVTWGGGAVTDLSWGGYDWSQVERGTTLTAYFEVNDENAAIRFGNGSWAALPSTKAIPGADGDGNISIAKGTSFMSFKLSQDDLNELVNSGGLVMCGTGYTISSITLSTEISQETTIWEGEALADDWKIQPYIGADGGKEFTDNNVQIGQTLYFYVTPTESNWQVQIIDGHWNGTTYGAFSNVGNSNEGEFTEIDLDAAGGRIGFTITEAMYNNALVAGGWGEIFVLNGDNLKVTKVTVI